MCRTIILCQKLCMLDVFTHYIFLLTFYKWNFKRLHYLPSWSSLDLNSKFPFILCYYSFIDEGEKQWIPQ